MARPERWLAGNNAEIYERYRVPAEFGPLARLFLAHIPLQSGDRVLDIACGTGVVTRLAAERVGASGAVVGVDCSAGMLAVARANAPRSVAQLDWREGDATALPFADGTFDVALCQQGLQFFPDRATALREMHRVLLPGGRLGIAVWRSREHNPYSAAVSDALARHVNEKAAAQIRTAGALGDRETLSALIAGAGFQDVDIRAETFIQRMGPPEESIPLSLSASGTVGSIVTALTENVRQALFADISAAVERYRDGSGLAIPRSALIALARKPATAGVNARR